MQDWPEHDDTTTTERLIGEDLHCTCTPHPDLATYQVGLSRRAIVAAVETVLLDPAFAEILFD